MILSQTALAEKSKHIQLKVGQAATESLWCYSKTSLHNLRNGVEKCQIQDIELQHLKKLNQELIQTQTAHKPIWQNWWIKVPLGIVVGGLVGNWVGEKSTSITSASLAGAVAGAAVVSILDVDF